MLKNQTKQLDNELFDQEYVDLQEWDELITHAYFYKLIEHLNKRIAVTVREIEKASKEPSSDNSYKIISLHSAKNELNGLLRKFLSLHEQKKRKDLDKKRRVTDNE